MNTTMTVAELLQHLVASLHYRTARTIEGAPEGFGDFEAGSGTRTPLEILRHMTMLVGRSRSVLRGSEWAAEAEVGFAAEYARFSAARLLAREQVDVSAPTGQWR